MTKKLVIRDYHGNGKEILQGDDDSLVFTSASGGDAVTVADGADVAEGATADAIVAAGAVGTISAKLRRVTQGLEDLKSLIVLALSSAPVLLSGNVGAAAAQLGNNAASKRGVFLKADDANTGDIFVGYANTVTADAGNATSGQRLKPGQGATFAITNSNLIWLIGSAAGQNYSGTVL